MPRISAIICFLALSLTSILFLGANDFSTRGEPREAIVAQSILRDGKWILPEGYAGDVPSKPPLLHWMIAIASLPIGEVTEFTARLPSVCAAFMGLLLIYSLIRKYEDEEIAFWSVVMLGSSFEWYRASMGCRVDMLFSALVAAAVIQFFKWEQDEFKGYPALGVIALSGAALAKGPAAIALTMGSFGLYQLIERRGLWRTVGRCALVAAPAVCLPLMWYAAAGMQRGEEFWGKIYYENVARFASLQEDEPHKHTVFYLYGMLLVGFLPWSIPACFGWIKERCLKKPETKKILNWWQRRSQLEKISLIVSVVTILFFSIPSSKRSVYLLPAYPFMAYLLCKSFFDLDPRALKLLQRVNNLLLIALGLPFLVIGSMMTTQSWQKAPMFKKLQELLGDTDSFYTLGMLLVGYGIVLILASIVTIRKREVNPIVDIPSPVLAVLFSCVGLGLILATSIVNPLIASKLSPKEFAQEVTREVSTSAKLYSFRNEFYGLSFYAKRRIDRLPAAGAGSGDFVVVYEENLAALDQLNKYEKILVSNGSVVSPGKKLALVKAK